VELALGHGWLVMGHLVGYFFVWWEMVRCRSWGLAMQWEGQVLDSMMRERVDRIRLTATLDCRFGYIYDIPLAPPLLSSLVALLGYVCCRDTPTAGCCCSVSTSGLTEPSGLRRAVDLMADCLFPVRGGSRRCYNVTRKCC
jgi:hypothetical protein